VDTLGDMKHQARPSKSSIDGQDSKPASPVVDSLTPDILPDKRRKGIGCLAETLSFSWGKNGKKKGGGVS